MFEIEFGVSGDGTLLGKPNGLLPVVITVPEISPTNTPSSKPIHLFEQPKTRNIDTPSEVQRETLCVSFVDVVGFSALMHEDEESTFHRWTELREQVVAPLIQKYGGTLVKSTGDGVMAIFDDPVEAVRWSRDVQTEARRRRQSLALRVSLNYCPVLRDGDDLLGDGVNIATPAGTCPSGRCHPDTGGSEPIGG